MSTSYTDGTADENGNRNGSRPETYQTLGAAKQRKKEIEYKEGLGQFIIPQCKYLRDLLDEIFDRFSGVNWFLSPSAGTPG